MPFKEITLARNEDLKDQGNLGKKISKYAKSLVTSIKDPKMS